MRITRLEILKVPPSWVWLRVHTDAGLVGLGEPYLEGHADSVIAEVRRLEPVLLGEDPRRTELLWKRMYDAGVGYRGGPVTMSAISGIDIALWDLKGKAADLPVYELLGGATRQRVKMYHAAGNRHLPPSVPAGHRMPAPDPSTDVGPGAVAGHIVKERGFRAVKVHLGPGERLESTTQVEALAAVVAETRDAVGPEVDVAVDIHNPHPAIAQQLIDALAPYRPLFIEEPVPLEDVAALGRLNARGIPIAAGERWMGKWQFRDALATGALSVVQPDIAHAGGITECVKIAAMADAAHAFVALHCPLSPVALAASLQVDAMIPNFLVQEHNNVNDTVVDRKTVIGAGFLDTPFVVDPSDGCVAVPDAPGIGVSLDDDALAELLALNWSSERA